MVAARHGWQLWGSLLGENFANITFTTLSCLLQLYLHVPGPRVSIHDIYLLMELRPAVTCTEAFTACTDEYGHGALIRISHDVQWLTWWFKTLTSYMSRQVGHDWDYVRASMDEDARATLRKLVTTGAKPADVTCLPHVVQVGFRKPPPNHAVCYSSVDAPA
jgi:hypothetical protein